MIGEEYEQARVIVALLFTMAILSLQLSVQPFRWSASKKIQIAAAPLDLEMTLVP
jgi:hypothetical protein